MSFNFVNGIFLRRKSSGLFLLEFGRMNECVKSAKMIKFKRIGRERREETSYVCEIIGTNLQTPVLF